MSSRKVVPLQPLRASADVPPRAVPEHLVALAEVGRELTRGTIAVEGFERALEVLDRRLGATRSVLYSLDPELRAIELTAAHGVTSEQLRPRYGLGVAGRVAASGRTIVVPRLRHEPMALSELASPAQWADQSWSLLAVPVSIGGRGVGVLSAYFPTEEKADFNGRLGVLEVVASLVAQALLAAYSDHADQRGSDEEARERSERVAFDYANMIGPSVAMRQIYEQISQVAQTNATALIQGHSGTGKELVAQAIHSNSPRAREIFVTVSCALPEQNFEAELFGSEEGPSGASTPKLGRLELAQGGTLLLDEITELSLATQTKLLRVLQSREFERVGGRETLRTNARIIAATNEDLEHAVTMGAFREDLYYRLSVFVITLPALSDRRADIKPLSEYFLARYAALHHRKIARLSSGALDILCKYSFPGNVRELEQVIERAVLVCDGFVVREHHLPEHVCAAAHEKAAEKLTLAEAVARLEREMIESALRQSRGNAARAARSLGTTERIVRYKAGKYGLEATRFRS